MTRERIIREINEERDAQDLLWGGPARDDLHTPKDWMWMLVRHLGLACDDSAGLTPDRYRRQLVRVAALAVAALESHDRLEGREDVPR